MASASLACASRTQGLSELEQILGVGFGAMHLSIDPLGRRRMTALIVTCVLCDGSATSWEA